MADPVTASEGARPYQQQAFLLHQLASAADGRLTAAESNAAIPKQIKGELGLRAAGAAAVRKAMAAAGWVLATKDGRVETHAITDAGRRRLREVEGYLPLHPVRGAVVRPVDGAMAVAREAYVLAAMGRAPGGTIDRDALARPPFKGQTCLRLNAATVRHVLAEAALRDEVRVTRAAGTESYRLTAKGAERLVRLREHCPVDPPTGNPTPAADEAIRAAREAFLLLRLLESPDAVMTEAAAAKVTYPKPTKLNHAAAWEVRKQLAAAGHVAVRRVGDVGSYSLTPAGRSYLSTLSFDAFADVKLKGPSLTRLLAAARETAGPHARPAGDGRPTPPSAARLEAAVMDVFRDLLRERFTVIDMVPIHEIRTEVATRLGPESATHAVFDELLLDLRRAKRLRLISISDRSRATPAQLQDSIVGVGETFFYVEEADALDPVG